MPRPEFGVRVSLEASVAPSEDPAKVRSAMSNVMGECERSVDEGPRRIRMRSEGSASLTKLHDQLRDRHVRTAARKLMMLERSGKETSLMLNRQAACADVIALCGSEKESPLGPLLLKIESKELDSVIQWLTAYESE